MAIIPNQYQRVWTSLLHNDLPSAYRALMKRLPPLELDIRSAGKGIWNSGIAITRETHHCIVEDRAGYEVLAPCHPAEEPASVFVKLVRTYDAAAAEEALRGMCLYRLYRFTPMFNAVFAGGFLKVPQKDKMQYAIIMKACSADLADFVFDVMYRTIEGRCPLIAAGLAYIRHPLTRRFNEVNTIYRNANFEMDELERDMKEFPARIARLEEKIAQGRLEYEVIESDPWGQTEEGQYSLSLQRDDLHEAMEDLEHARNWLKKKVARFQSGEPQRALAEATEAMQAMERERQRVLGPAPDISEDDLDLKREYDILDKTLVPFIVVISLQVAVLDYAMLRYMDAEQSDHGDANYLVDYVTVVDGVAERPLMYRGVDLTQKTHITFVVDGKTFSVPIRVDVNERLSYVFVVKNGDPGQMEYGRFQFNPHFRNLLQDQTFDTSIRQREENRSIVFERIYRSRIGDIIGSVFINLYPLKIHYTPPKVTDLFSHPEEYTANYLWYFLVENCRGERPSRMDTMVIDWNALEDVRVSAQIGA